MENIGLISIYCGASLSLLMALFHSRFYKIFIWKKELEKLTVTNKSVLYTIHIALILLFLCFSVISFVYAKELSECKGISLGICLCYSLFWLWRTVWHVFYFKPGKSGKPLPLHYLLFILVFFILFASYFLPVILRLFFI